MTTTPEPQRKPAPGLPEQTYLLAAFVGVLVLWFNPMRVAMDTSLDLSGIGLFSYYTHNGFQFGKDAIHVVGPLGFVNYGVYMGALYYEKYALELIVTAIAAALLLAVRRRPRDGAAHLGIVVCALIAWRQPDVAYMLGLILAAAFLLRRTEQARNGIAVSLTSGFIGFYCLTKGTYVTGSLVATFLVVFAALLERQHRLAINVVVSFCAVVVLGWLSAGQDIWNFGDYLWTTFIFSAGYNEANALDERWPVFLYGVASALLLGSLIAVHVAAYRKRRRVVLFGALCLFFTFVMWKQGFVRADRHVQRWFYFALAFTLLAPVLLGGSQTKFAVRPGEPGGLQAHPFQNRALSAVAYSLSVLVLCSAAVGSALEPAASLHLGELPGDLTEQIRLGVHSIAQPEIVRDRLRAKLESNAQAGAMPHTRSIVGDQPVDLFGYEAALPILNGFNYRPRPVAPPFEAHGASLMERNRAFMRDRQGRPPYVLLTMRSIDKRLPSQDDALALHVLLTEYRPVLYERSYLLLKDRAQVAVESTPTELGSLVTSFDELVSLPSLEADEVLVAYLDIQLSWLGKIRALLYKPPIVDIEIRYANGGRRTNRVLPSNVENGFVIDPPLSGLFDVYQYFHVGEVLRAEAFKVVPTRVEYLAYFVDLVGVRFSKYRRDVRRADYAFFPGFNVVPKGIEAVDIRIDRVPEGEVLYVHAPSVFRLAIDGAGVRLRADFGILASAYEGEPCTDGVDFEIRISDGADGSSVIWQRRLDPVANPADRGLQSVDLELPPALGGELWFTTGNGPAQHGSCDFSYWRDVRMD